MMMWADEMGSLLTNWVERCRPPCRCDVIFLRKIGKKERWKGSFTLSEPGFDPGTLGRVNTWAWAYHGPDYESKPNFIIKPKITIADFLFPSNVGTLIQQPSLVESFRLRYL
ncbi:unnamed protein product [Citrullus colocynthis]|uniref:Uncharacterized protein n=1 Tax=Citrullus colocynthis TaxID=252529 RepID=A0ABP0YI94_9ROSI